MIKNIMYVFLACFLFVSFAGMALEINQKNYAVYINANGDYLLKPKSTNDTLISSSNVSFFVPSQTKNLYYIKLKDGSYKLSSSYDKSNGWRQIDAQRFFERKYALLVAGIPTEATDDVQRASTKIVISESSNKQRAASISKAINEQLNTRSRQQNTASEKPKSLRLEKANAFGTPSYQLSVNHFGKPVFNYPLQLPAGIGDIRPSISIGYKEKSNAMLGQGLSLNATSIIARCNKSLPIDGFDKQVMFNEKDALCLNGMRLININSNAKQIVDGSEYRTMIDEFSKIQALKSGADFHFKAYLKNGNTQYFKEIIWHQLGSKKIAKSWLLSEEKDRFGNSIHYKYKELGANNKVIKKITYDKSVIEFDYESTQRPDQFSSYANSFKTSPVGYLNKISTYITSNGQRIKDKEYRFIYGAYTKLNNSLKVEKIQECAYANNTEKHCKAPLSLTWPDDGLTYKNLDSKLKHNAEKRRDYTGRIDFNNDGHDDIYTVNKNTIFISLGDGKNSLFSKKFKLYSVSENQYIANISVADLNLDGKPDFIFRVVSVNGSTKTHKWQALYNQGVSQSPKAVDLTSGFRYGKSYKYPIVLDINNDRYVDVILPKGNEPMSVYINNSGSGFNKAKAILPNSNKVKSLFYAGKSSNIMNFIKVSHDNELKSISFDGNNLVKDKLKLSIKVKGFYPIDINADGQIDIVSYEGDKTYLYINTGQSFIKKPLLIKPNKIFQDSTSLLHYRDRPIKVQDINSDGLDDLVFTDGIYIYALISNGNTLSSKPTKLTSFHGIDFTDPEAGSKYVLKVNDVKAECVANLSDYFKKVPASIKGVQFPLPRYLAFSQQKKVGNRYILDIDSFPGLTFSSFVKDFLTLRSASKYVKEVNKGRFLRDVVGVSINAENEGYNYRVDRDEKILAYLNARPHLKKQVRDAYYDTSWADINKTLNASIVIARSFENILKHLDKYYAQSSCSGKAKYIQALKKYQSQFAPLKGVLNTYRSAAKKHYKDVLTTHSLPDFRLLYKGVILATAETLDVLVQSFQDGKFDASVKSLMNLPEGRGAYDFIFADIDGDGRVDILKQVARNDSQWGVNKNQTAHSGLLSSISDFKITNKLEYANLANTQYHKILKAQQKTGVIPITSSYYSVVTKQIKVPLKSHVSTDNTLKENTFSYSGFLNNALGFGNMGAKSVEIHQPYKKQFSFNQYYQEFPKTGLIKEQLVYAGSNAANKKLILKKLTDIKVSNPLPANSNIVAPQISTVSWEHSELDSIKPYQYKKQTYEYDNYGNNTVYKETTSTDEIGINNPSSITHIYENNNKYQVDKSNWLISFPASQSYRWVYTAPNTKTPNRIRFKQRTAQTGTLRVAKEELFGEQGLLHLKQEFTYTPQGVLKSKKITGESMSARTIQYSEFVQNRWPAKEINNEFGSSAPIEYEYDIKTGAILTKGIAGQTKTHYRYDAFGVEQEVKNAQGKLSQRVVYQWCNAASSQPQCEAKKAAYKRIEKHYNKPEIIKYYGAFDNLLMISQQSFKPTERVLTTFVYDNFGNKIKQSQRYKTGEQPSYTSFSKFDSKNRPLSIADDHKRLSISYKAGAMGTIKTIRSFYNQNAMLNAQTQIFYDHLGNPSKKIETSLNANQGAYHVKTEFAYDSQLNVRRISIKDEKKTNQAAVITNKEYDVFGNLIQLDDPNTGISKFSYNGQNQLIKKQDAQGLTTRYKYDNLGRKIEESDSAQHVYQWFYDKHSQCQTNQQAKGLLLYGKVCLAKHGKKVLSQQETIFARAYRYNLDGQLSQDLAQYHTLILEPKKHIDTLYEYDEKGRHSTTQYASGFAYKKAYSQTGYLNKLFNAQHTYWQAYDYASSNKASEFVLGNGIQTSHQYDTAGHIRSINVTGKQPILNETYHWLDQGVLQSKHTQIPALKLNEQKTFHYDGLKRLTQERKGKESIQYRYDGLGNIQYHSKLGQYRYHEQKPNAVRQVGNTLYRYNRVGNMVSRGAQQISYNSHNKPTQILSFFGIQRFIYGANDELVQQYKQGNITYYSDNQQYQEIRALFGNTTRYVHQIEGLVSIEISKEWGQNKQRIRYLHKDYLGSVKAISDGTGKLLRIKQYRPFGFANNRNFGNQPTYNQSGFTGHMHIKADGLIHMKGRVYDSAIGRFITPDPLVQAPYFSQSYNRYSYVWNNPLGYIDPTGYEVKEIYLQGSILTEQNSNDVNRGIWNLSVDSGYEQLVKSAWIMQKPPRLETIDGITTLVYPNGSNIQLLNMPSSLDTSGELGLKSFYPEAYLIGGAGTLRAGGSFTRKFFIGKTFNDFYRTGPTVVSKQIIDGPGTPGAVVTWAMKGGGPRSGLPFHYHVHKYNWYKPWQWFKSTPIIKSRE